jgi:hypothetical protein
MDQFALLELLEMLKDAQLDERIRVAAQNVHQALIDVEAGEKIDAGRWERTDAHTAMRNGSRARVLLTTAGDLELRIPKLRGVVLPDAVGAAPADRSGVAHGGDGGVRARRLHAQGR